MANRHIFSHPNQLSEFARHVQQDAEPAPVHIKLELLHALEDDVLLAESRNPASKFMRDGNGPRYDCPSEQEYLNITALGKMWREAMRSVPPKLVESITFDQTLPQTLQIDGGELSLHWETTLTSAGVAVLTMDVSNLIISMATVLRMRRGGSVTFNVMYDDTERPIDSHVRELDKILHKLSE